MAAPSQLNGVCGCEGEGWECECHMGGALGNALRKDGSVTPSCSGSIFTTCCNWTSSSSVGSVSVRPDALYELVLGLGLGGGGGAQRPVARDLALDEPWTNSGEAPRLGLGSL